MVYKLPTSTGEAPDLWTINIMNWSILFTNFQLFTKLSPPIRSYMSSTNRNWLKPLNHTSFVSLVKAKWHDPNQPWRQWRFPVCQFVILGIGCRLHNSLSTRVNKTGPKLVMSWIISEHASHMNDLACKCSDKWISCKTMYVHVGRITRSFIPKTSVNNLHTK